MATLSEYSNVYNTALNILDQKGFRLWYDDETNMFCAEKDGWDFMAESPCGLLGVVSIYEHIKPNFYEEGWWRINNKDLYPNNIKKSKPSYNTLSQNRINNKKHPLP